MADGIDVTPGAGKTVATDDVTIAGGVAGQVQYVKLADGTPNGTASIAVDVGVKANALRTAPANDITDGTYIGDIKFGEALPAGTNGIGKLTANSGVDIGDVTLTAGTNLVGKVSIDQVTANANEVVVKSGTVTAVTAITNALPAGTNLIGKTSIDQVTANANEVVIKSGTVTAVTAITNALPAGTNGIGKLTANTGVDIGDVDVTSVVPGVAATNLGKAEDAAHASGDVGVAAMSVRADAAAALSGADNDYQPLITDANGRLHVLDANTAAITTAVQIMDDWDATHDSAASADGPQMMAAYDATSPAVVDDGDAVRVLADEYGRLLAGVEKTAWQDTLDSVDATAAGVVVKASAANIILVIQSFIISSDIEGWAHLVDETDVVLTGKFWLKAGGGVAITLPDKAPIVMVVNRDLEFRCEAAGAVSVTVTGYTIPG